MKKAREIRIFLSSPGDVSADWPVIKGVAAEIEETMGDEFGFRLRIVNWEDFCPGSEPIQDTINQQAADYDYDIYVGLMYKRFGTPTKRAGSGTEEEFDIAFERRKNSEGRGPHILFYFCEKPFIPGREDLDQYPKVLEFKEKVENKILVKKYNEATELEKNFRKDLNKLLCKHYINNGAPPPPSGPGTSGARFCDELKDEDWELLTTAAIQSVISGAMSAMGFYNQKLAWSIDDTAAGEIEKNPSTEADLRATASILQTIDTYLTPLHTRLNSALSYLAEETKPAFMEKLTGYIENKNLAYRIREPEDFFNSYDRSIRVIIDAIDGTGSFIRGIPLFCSAAGILIGQQPRVAAVYDPTHHIVYYGSLRGPYENPEANAYAYAWQVASNTKTNLVELAAEIEKKGEKNNLDKEAIGVHFTRSKRDKLKEFLRPATPDSMSVFEKISDKAGCIYALNSGLLAMIKVATGSLGGFINNVTNPWDVAAGEVIVKACGGKVTRFDGAPIDYSSKEKTSLISTKKHLYDDIFRCTHTP